MVKPEGERQRWTQQTEEVVLDSVVGIKKYWFEFSISRIKFSSVKKDIALDDLCFFSGLHISVILESIREDGSVKS